MLFDSEWVIKGDEGYWEPVLGDSDWNLTIWKSNGFSSKMNRMYEPPREVLCYKSNFAFCCHSQGYDGH